MEVVVTFGGLGPGPQPDVGPRPPARRWAQAPSQTLRAQPRAHKKRFNSSGWRPLGDEVCECSINFCNFHSRIAKRLDTERAWKRSKIMHLHFLQIGTDPQCSKPDLSGPEVVERNFSVCTYVLLSFSENWCELVCSACMCNYFYNTVG